jgi:microcystin-dependent protein
MPTTGRLLLPYPESTDTADVPRDVKALADRIEALTAWIRQADFAPGAGVHWPGDLKFSAVTVSPVADWLKCDGTSYPRATYPELFTALGGAASPWGLPSGTHFNVPDLRGRSPMGAGQGPGLNIRNIGQLTGEELHVLTAGEMAPHSHQYDKTTVSGSGSGQAGSNLFVMTGTAINPTATVQSGAPAQGHNTVHPVAVVNVFIKT